MWSVSAPPGSSTFRRTNRSGRNGQQVASPTRCPLMNYPPVRKRPHPPLQKMSTTRMGIWIRELGAGQVLIESKVFDVITTIHQDWFPHLLQGSVLVVGEIAQLKAKCWSWWGGGSSPPHPIPNGTQAWGTTCPQWSLCPPLASGLPSWPGGYLGGVSFLQVSYGLEGRVRDASPLGPPHPSCLQVSKQYILGAPSAPTPDLSWQVWVSLTVSQGRAIIG